MKEAKYIITLESNGENPKSDFRFMCESFRKMEVYGGGVCRVKSIKPHKT
jgi:hypothetical protein